MKKILIISLLLSLIGNAEAAPKEAKPIATPSVLFDVSVRKAQLQRPEYSKIKEYCLAKNITISEDKLSPISGLKGTKGYGSDNRAAPFSWAVMVYGGRALAGDVKSEKLLIELLLNWAKSDAFSKNDIKHDTYYAMKRVMLPVVISYSIVADKMDKNTKKIVYNWIDKNVRLLDKRFGGIVDVNNHRYLADSVLMAWSVIAGDNKLYKQAISRYNHALNEALPDGSLQLETRRGARAAWYMRHALTSLTVIAEIAAQKDKDLYSLTANNISIDNIMAYYLNVVNNPITILPDAAENYIPGHRDNYMVQDMGMLDLRGKTRHYMAFAERWLTRTPNDKNRLTLQRLSALMKRPSIANARPLIDDYTGGNATCFWGKP